MRVYVVNAADDIFVMLIKRQKPSPDFRNKLVIDLLDVEMKSTRRSDLRFWKCEKIYLPSSICLLECIRSVDNHSAALNNLHACIQNIALTKDKLRKLDDLFREQCIMTSEN